MFHDSYNLLHHIVGYLYYKQYYKPIYLVSTSNESQGPYFRLLIVVFYNKNNDLPKTLIFTSNMQYWPLTTYEVCHPSLCPQPRGCNCQVVVKKIVKICGPYVIEEEAWSVAHKCCLVKRPRCPMFPTFPIIQTIHKSSSYFLLIGGVKGFSLLNKMCMFEWYITRLEPNFVVRKRAQCSWFFNLCQNKNKNKKMHNKRMAIKPRLDYVLKR